MDVEIDFKVTRQTLIDAKAHVERQHVLFFDFFRDCVFGFVQVSKQPFKGFYARAAVKEDGPPLVSCKCKKRWPDTVCGHALALYLKLFNWPLDHVNLSESFESHPLCRFFKSLGTRHFTFPLDQNTNPSLDLAKLDIDPRLSDYWSFTSEKPLVARRDRLMLTEAKLESRSPQEKAMLRKKMPSAKVLFEESGLYPLCKLFFLLDRGDGLDIRVSRGEDHQIALEIRHERRLLFKWTLAIDTFIKGMREDWDYWLERTDTEIHRMGKPIVYQIRFREDNALEISPMVQVGMDRFEPLDAVMTPGANNLHYHEDLGYFRIQTGLSLFEMEFAQPGVSIVDAQKVKNFLKQHRDTLEGLDRGLMDEALFGEVVLEQFDRFDLKLTAYENKRFSYDLETRTGELNLSTEELIQMLSESGRYRKVGGKLFDSAGYDGVYLGGFLHEKNKDAISVGDLFRILMFFKDRLKINTNEITSRIFEELEQFTAPDPPDLSHTKLALRVYQQLGYQWLYFLRTHGLGGLLCDQMGLGKTHQGMALIASVLVEIPEARILVVAPTSVLYHWKDKLNAFCPGIEVTLHHGPERDVAQLSQRRGVIVSTYGTLRNDAEQLKDTIFEVILFDEIQYLKNKKTKGYRELSRLEGLTKIGLTGTPIQNNIDELKALFDLVFPGFLGTDLHFKHFFGDPITRFRAKEPRQKLQTLVRPFIMRRSKAQVLPELPDKTEDLRPFVLSAYEMDLYQQTKTKGKLKMNDESGAPVFMHIFQLIDKLKRICNHPALFFDVEDYTAYPSAKWDMFVEILAEALAGGDKVVVFTQYLGMIAMFQKYLTHLGLAHATITGSTRNREEERKRFMEDPDCRVFLGTLKAGGVGIDLTEANIVIHYDRWWNPAWEEQATDRVHRFGQKKVVQTFKFKALHTVEERIDAIIANKRYLLNDLIGFDSEDAAKRLTIEDLLEILA